MAATHKTDQADPSPLLACDECGCPDAVEVAERKLCAECLQKCGSCCGIDPD